MPTQCRPLTREDQIFFRECWDLFSVHFFISYCPLIRCCLLEKSYLQILCKRLVEPLDSAKTNYLKMVENNSISEQRSRNMAAIKSKNTKPEMVVRRSLHSMGYRFRLHKRDLPGNPDIVLPRYKIALFVNGCFWHRHEGCKYSTIPKTRTEFWIEKFRGNVERDKVNQAKLISMGWTPLIIWECETKKNVNSLLASYLQVYRD